MVVSESAFSAKNLKGVKIIERFIDKVGKSVRRESYYFKVSNEKKIAFTCTVAKKTKAELDDVFDEMAASLISR